MVIKVALVAPTAEEQNRLGSWLKSCLPESDNQWTAFGYSRAETLLWSVRESGFRPDVVLLPAGTLGYSMGRRLRRADHHCVIIYLPASAPNYPDALPSCPIAHLEVDQRSQYRQALKNAMEYLEDARTIESEQVETDGYFHHANQKQLIHMKYANIDYFESDLHRVIIHRSDGTTEAFIGKLSEIQGSCAEDFERVHQSYLVHVKHIERVFLKSRRLLFYSGEEAFASKALFPAFLARHPELEVINDV